MARRPATRILWVALGLGVAVIFSASLFAELRRERRERACVAGEIAACEALCSRGGEAGCAELARRCEAREPAACRAVESAKGSRRQRARW